MKTKIEEKRKARKFRKKGWSVPRIAQEVGVSEGSVSLWTRDIKLSASQKAVLTKRSRGLWNEKWRQKWLDKRKVYQEAGRQLAKQDNRLHLTGCMLYWAEGSKKRNTVNFANADIRMMKIFVKFLRKCYSIEPSEILISICCHLDHGLSLAEVENWWLRQLELPRSSIRKGIVVTKQSKRRKKRLKYGVCSAWVHKTEVVQSIFGAIQEYGGFEDETWLDC